ncbi:low specificity L-threonine aldolase [Maritalea mobilis]|uniref:threonine aldolase family protein n=1 Tax=Maritalea mobilis TaxID=483324 RepID=UPI001C94F734|nr:low specificity L-threonine aldolase [Maritalea mobilis]MBY6201199.1 low specificity L-threonine aldolase [Maritalea mobilis]
MMFASDNTGPAHPNVMEAVTRANEGYAMPYGNDALSGLAADAMRRLFEAPDAAVHLVATGTAANSLALGVMANPWDAVFCHRVAHVEEDECGAPEFFTNGAKLTLIDGADGKMTPEALARAIEHTGDKGVHGVQRGPVTITQITEVGTAYSLDEIRALTDVAKSFGLKTHLDGARFANACAALGCTPAEMTWKAGIDAVSFGGTKNGCLGVEAVVLFDPELSWEFQLRRKRAAHLWSKHRYLAAQMLAYVTNDLWLDTAKAANARCAELAAALRAIPEARLLHDPAGNMIFAELPRGAHKRAMEAGAQYYLFPFQSSLEGPEDELIRCRLVTDWSCKAEDVARVIDLWRG